MGAASGEGVTAVEECRTDCQNPEVPICTKECIYHGHIVEQEAPLSISREEHFSTIEKEYLYNH